MDLHLIVQGSDFQNAGVRGNLAKIDSVVKHSAELGKKGGLVSLLLVGDQNDASANEQQFAAFAPSYLAELKKQKPDVHDALEEWLGMQIALQQKYGDKVMEMIATSKIPQSELEPIIEMQQQFMQVPEARRLLQYKAEEAPRINYAVMNRMFAKAGGTVYAIPGNHDPSYMSRQLSNAQDLEHKVMQAGKLRLAGANNTNHSGELVFDEEHAFPCDDPGPVEASEAYQLLNKATVGKSIDVLALHGPPNGVGLREKYDNQSKGITKLIDEHKPKLVACGHFDKNASLKKVGDTVYARSSINCYFVHKFDGDKYIGTEVYRYDIEQKKAA